MSASSQVKGRPNIWAFAAPGLFGSNDLILAALLMDVLGSAYALQRRKDRFCKRTYGRMINVLGVAASQALCFSTTRFQLSMLINIRSCCSGKA